MKARELLMKVLELPLETEVVVSGFQEGGVEGFELDSVKDFEINMLVTDGNKFKLCFDLGGK